MTTTPQPPNDVPQRISAENPWQTGTPTIPEGSQNYFLCAVLSKNANGDKIYTRPLSYLNRYEMPLADHLDETPDCAEDVDGRDDPLWTGWFEEMCDTCEVQLHCTQEVIAWMALPKYQPTAPTMKPKQELNMPSFACTDGEGGPDLSETLNKLSPHSVPATLEAMKAKLNFYEEADELQRQLYLSEQHKLSDYEKENSSLRAKLTAAELQVAELTRERDDFKVKLDIHALPTLPCYDQSKLTDPYIKRRP